MLERIQPTLAMLDQGLSLYRRHFLSFVLLAAAWFVPVAVLVGLAVALGRRLDEGVVVLLVLLGGMVGFVLMIYLVAALSRAASAVLNDQPLRLSDMLRIHPLRLFAMTIFTIIYLLLSQIFSTVISLICICPAYIFGLALVGGAAAVGGEAASTGSLLLFLLIFGAIYLLSLFLSGAIYSGMIYGLQPWAQEHASFGVSLQRSIDLLVYRFWRNIGAWGLAALLLAASGFTVTVAVGVALPLPLIWVFGAETPLVQAVTIGTWLVGLVLVLPPLPIWMAMLYQRNRAAREGGDLQMKVDTWWQQHFAETSAGG